MTSSEDIKEFHWQKLATQSSCSERIILQTHQRPVKKRICHGLALWRHHRMIEWKHQSFAWKWHLWGKQFRSSSPGPIREPIHEDDIRAAANESMRPRITYHRSVQRGETTEPEAGEVNWGWEIVEFKILTLDIVCWVEASLNEWLVWQLDTTKTLESACNNWTTCKRWEFADLCAWNGSLCRKSTQKFL